MHQIYLTIAVAVSRLTFRMSKAQFLDNFAGALR